MDCRVCGGTGYTADSPRCPVCKGTGQKWPKTYRIVRNYENSTRVIHTGLTLLQAQCHVRDREADSDTARLPRQRERTKKLGRWFDTYEEEQ